MMFLEEDNTIPGLEIRYTTEDDRVYLKQWLHNPNLAKAFPMSSEYEVEDAVVRWISFAKYKCSLTAVMYGVPCGIATLYLQPYRKLVHQCEFGIIISEELRSKGVGGALLLAVMKLAKEQFRIELIHLQVHAENPAIRFYQRYGFREFGRQNSWMKEDNSFIGRVFMERFL